MSSNIIFVVSVKKMRKSLAGLKKTRTFAPANDKTAENGAIAQLVEQRTENPCVPGSIPGGTTQEETSTHLVGVSFAFILSSSENR